MASNTFDINLLAFKNYICSFYIDFRFMFVMFPRLCQNLCLCMCTIFRQPWTIRGSDTEVYPFSKCWHPLFCIFIISHLIIDLLRMRVILPPHSKFHLNGKTCSWVIAKKLLPAGCHGNLTVLNLLSASVTKISIFAPEGKTMHWIEKWLVPFTIDTTFSISMQSLG